MQTRTLRETERRVDYVRHFSRDQIGQFFVETGWNLHRIWNTGVPFHDLSKWYANRNPDKTIRRFREQAYGWAEKGICVALRVAFKLDSKRHGAQLFTIAEKTEA